jgi:hypothetical protein
MLDSKDEHDRDAIERIVKSALLQSDFSRVSEPFGNGNLGR